MEGIRRIGVEYQDLQVLAWEGYPDMESGGGSFLHENVSYRFVSSSLISATSDILWQKVEKLVTTMKMRDRQYHDNLNTANRTVLQII